MRYTRVLLFLLIFFTCIYSPLSLASGGGGGGNIEYTFSMLKITPNAPTFLFFIGIFSKSANANNACKVLVVMAVNTGLATFAISCFLSSSSSASATSLTHFPNSFALWYNPATDPTNHP